ncbi:MAG: hypothetical protein MPW15_28555 [Candidatus Manganitrophus sp.]|nr:hypothetical protein [Candidatus Manganitrophus sp.]
MGWGWVPFNRPFWGIDIGASSVKVVRLCRTRQGIKLLDIGIKEFPPGQDLGQESIASALEELIKEKSGREQSSIFQAKHP